MMNDLNKINFIVLQLKSIRCDFSLLCRWTLKNRLHPGRMFCHKFGSQRCWCGPYALMVGGVLRRQMRPFGSTGLAKVFHLFQS